MSRYDELHAFQDASSHEKLAILRHEMIVPLETIRGFAEIIQLEVVQKNIEGLPEDFAAMVKHIITSADYIKAVLETMTGGSWERKEREDCSPRPSV